MEKHLEKADDGHTTGVTKGVEKRLALLISAVSLIWVLFEQIAIGKSLINALGYSVGYLGVLFAIAGAVAIVVGLFVKKHSVTLMVFSGLYALLFLSLKLLPMLV